MSFGLVAIPVIWFGILMAGLYREQQAQSRALERIARLLEQRERTP